MKRWWLSWYEAGNFELNFPWWRTGLAKNGVTFCAAVLAPDEDAARQVVVGAHDEPPAIEWRFIHEKPDDWSPFSDRFPRADWMPWPAGEADDG